MIVSRQSTGHRNGKDTHTMSKDNVIAIKKPDTFVDDPISEILRQGARNLISQALEIELELFINQYKDLRDQMGLQRIVRNGYLPERQIQTGIGPVSVKAPRIRDRHQNASKRIHYRPTSWPSSRSCLDIRREP